MNLKKKWVAVVLLLAMILPLTKDFSAGAAETVTVLLRVEKDSSTELAPVSVTLTDADKRDFGIGLGTKDLTPLHALAKYLEKEKNVTDEEMSKYIIASPSSYGLYVSGISMSGDGIGSAATGETDNIYWNYRVNDAYADVGMDTYALKNGDSLVFYGMWSPYPAEDEVLYAKFEKTTYSALTSKAVTVTLMGLGVRYENSDAIPYEKPINGATVTALVKEDKSEGSEKNTDSVAGDIYQVSRTDAQGRATLTFRKEGIYILSAYRQAADGKHFDISRPYAEVKVENDSIKTPAVSSGPSDKDTSKKPSLISGQGVKKVTKPSKIKVKVNKSKGKKKKITVTWKKAVSSGIEAGKVTGYQVVVSKKKKSGYKRVAQTKKRKVSFQKKKGTYYVKVRAYKIYADKKKMFGSYSKPVVVNVK